MVATRSCSNVNSIPPYTEPTVYAFGSWPLRPREDHDTEVVAEVREHARPQAARAMAEPAQPEPQREVGDERGHREVQHRERERRDDERLGHGERAPQAPVDEAAKCELLL